MRGTDVCVGMQYNSIYRGTHLPLVINSVLNVIFLSEKPPKTNKISTDYTHYSSTSQNHVGDSRN